MSILKVLSNLKHNGDNFKAGDFIEGEIANFETLITDGIVKHIVGATNEAEAREIDAKEQAQVAAEAAKEEEIAPKDTWAPTKPEEVVAPAAAPVETAPAAEEKKEGFLDKVFGGGDKAPEKTQAEIDAEAAAEAAKAAGNL